MKIKILYEDSNILVIDKPSGIAVHPDGRSKAETITDWVLTNYPKMKNVGEPLKLKIKNDELKIDKPGVVHRLDKETSGVLLLAKNQKAHQFLKEQFQKRTIKKVYVAIVNGWVKNDRGIINKPIGRSPKDFRRWLAGRGARGEMREAITQYKVLKRFQIGLNKFTELEVRPKTGRTHQIRVHLKFLNHPIVCDSLYNPAGACPKDIKRLALHAQSIIFKDMKGKEVKVESLLPQEFENMIK